MTEACFSCQEDIQDPEPVGVQVTAESGPEGRPLYRCAACTSQVHAITASLQGSVR
jgi:hypothetical protein